MRATAPLLNPESEHEGYGSIHKTTRNKYVTYRTCQNVLRSLLLISTICIVTLFFHFKIITQAATYETKVNMETMIQQALSEIEFKTDQIKANILSTKASHINTTKLARMWKNTYPFTANHSWRAFPEDNTIFVSTGDIPQMWLRDSSVQMNTYLPQIAERPNSSLRRVFEGVLKRQIRFIDSDPYASAFHFHKQSSPRLCEPQCGDFTYQSDFELDSLMFPCWLHYKYWRITGATNHLGHDFFNLWQEKILPLLRTEQYHHSKSPYYYKPELNPVKDGIGLIWSFARPSDDQTKFGYNIPENIFAVVCLAHLSDMAILMGYHHLARDTKELAIEIDNAIHKYGVFRSPSTGKLIYAFEVDGFGNKTFQDDANMPNLLWLPYIGYNSSFRELLHGRIVVDDYYPSTRDFSLSRANPNYFSGKYSGLGSQHASHGLRPITHGPECNSHCVWPLGLVMTGFTGKNQKEKIEIMNTLLSTDDEQNLLHEGFDANNPAIYNRDWFGWANGLFSSWVLEIYSSI